MGTGRMRPPRKPSAGMENTMTTYPLTCPRCHLVTSPTAPRTVARTMRHCASSAGLSTWPRSADAHKHAEAAEQRILEAIR